MKINKLIYFLLPLLVTGACNAQQTPDSKVPKTDTIKKAAVIIRHKTLFDRKDTNSVVGKCYLKLDSNLACFVEVAPLDTAYEWLLPFNLKNRMDTTQVKIRSPFGANRSSHLRGHKHSGADLVLYNRDTGIYIYPAAKGIVCFKKIKDPFSCITIKHKMPDGTFIFTSYIHLKEIYVSNGDTVDVNTRIAKLFSQREVRRFRGPYNHLHFEVRKNFDDFGFASAHCMNRSELDSFFYEPVDFIRAKIKQELACKSKKASELLGDMKKGSK